MEVCKVMLLFSCQSSTALCDDHSGPSQVTLVVKKPSANARDRKCGFLTQESGPPALQADSVATELSGKPI